MKKTKLFVKKEDYHENDREYRKENRTLKPVFASIELVSCACALCWFFCLVGFNLYFKTKSFLGIHPLSDSAF